MSSFAIHARDISFSDYITPEYVTSANSLAAGNATLTDDIGPQTIFINPAARLPAKKHSYSIINSNFEYNSLSYDETVGRKGLSPAAVREATSFIRLSKMESVLRERGGGLLHQRLNLLGHYQYKRFTIGYFTSFESNGALENTNNTFLGNKRKDSALFMHYSSKLSRRLLVGITYNFLNRDEQTSPLFNMPTPAQELEERRSRERQGRMHDFTLGFKYKLGRNNITQLGLVLRNLLGSNFSPLNGTKAPERIPTTADIALSYRKSKRSPLGGELAIRDIAGSYSESLGRKVQLGMSYRFKKNYFVKLGYLDSALTCGFGGRVWKRLNASFASYSVDTSETGIVNRDRRFIFQLSL